MSAGLNLAKPYRACLPDVTVGRENVTPSPCTSLRREPATTVCNNLSVYIDSTLILQATSTCEQLNLGSNGSA